MKKSSIFIEVIVFIYGIKADEEKVKLGEDFQNKYWGLCFKALVGM